VQFRTYFAGLQQKKENEGQVVFKTPLVYFGKGSLAKVRTLKGERALIVGGKKSTELGFVSNVETILKSKGFEVKAFNGLEPEPKDSTIFNCAKLAAEFKPDWFIGLGGGSSMDVAKASFFLYERPEADLHLINPTLELGLRKKARLAEISTTSGTGSEVTCAYVFTDSKTGRKVLGFNFEFIPDVAIVDPKLAFKMPPQLRADTGLDALSHAVESYICNLRNSFADTLAIRTIQNVFQYLERSYKTGDEQAMEQMHYAATYGGMAITSSLTSTAHIIGHVIGALFHVPHGRAVGLVLPYFVEYCGKTSKTRYLEILKALQVEGATLEDSTQKFSTMIRDLMAEIKEPTKVSDLGIKEEKFKEKIPSIANFAVMDGAAALGPRTPSGKELPTMLEYMLTGKPIDF
jgi:alcohol dehydrogenase class IV